MANKFVLEKNGEKDRILVSALEVDEAGDLLLYINGNVALYLECKGMLLHSTFYADQDLGIRAHGIPRDC